MFRILVLCSLAGIILLQFDMKTAWELNGRTAIIVLSFGVLFYRSCSAPMVMLSQRHFILVHILSPLE
jgi:hypothetical protein